MRIGKRILACFMSFAITVMMMCGLFVVDAGAEYATVTFSNVNASVDYSNWKVNISTNITAKNEKPWSIKLAISFDNKNFTLEDAVYYSDTSSRSYSYYYKHDVGFGYARAGYVSGESNSLTLYYKFIIGFDYSPDRESSVYSCDLYSLGFSNPSASNVTSNGAVLSATSKEVGVMLSENGGEYYTAFSQSITHSLTSYSVSCSLSTLKAGSTYNYKFYAKIGNGLKYSSVGSFSTDGEAIQTENVDFTELSYWSVTTSSVWVACRITYKINQPSNVGVVISKDGGNYITVINKEPLPMNNNTSKFTYTIGDLTPGSNYSFMYFAIINGKTYYSAVKSFKTQEVVYSDITTPNLYFNKYFIPGGELMTAYWDASPSDSNLDYYWLVIADPDNIEIVSKRIEKNEDCSYIWLPEKPGEWKAHVWAIATNGNTLEDYKTFMAYPPYESICL